MNLNKNYRCDNILVTGGAGFIGSYLVDRLLLQFNSLTIHVLDNLSNGSIEYISNWKTNYNNRFRFYKLDLVKDNLDELNDKYKIIFHLAANPDVRSSSVNPKIHLEQNILATFNILEHARKVDAETIVFTSSSTVYGEAEKIPTPEDYAPLKPISMYGASKLACEALISSYSSMYGFKAIIYRLANIIGGRSRHGVIYDFVNKLRKNSKELEILGDGKQKKSYLYVNDCVDAMLIGLKSRDKVNILNIGSSDCVTVIDIAESIKDYLGLHDLKFKFVDSYNGRGWNGDVKFMLLDTSKIRSLGWIPMYDNSINAVKATLKEIIKEC